MFGDGTVSESDALYHWGHWARQEIASGENVIEKKAYGAAFSGLPGRIVPRRLRWPFAGALGGEPLRTASAKGAPRKGLTARAGETTPAARAAWFDATD